MKKSKKILLKWAATYGADEEDVRASMYNEDMMIEFAKYYHKQKLTLTDVVKSSHCELYDFGRQGKTCEKKCDTCKWMEGQ